MDVLDHVGIAVEDLDQAVNLYTSQFGYVLESEEDVPSQHVRVAFLKLQNTKLELLAPTSEGSTLTKFLARRGPGLHHVCYRVDDIEASLAELEAKGVELIDTTPRPGAHNTRIAFLHPKSCGGVLTELCEYC